MDTGSGLKGELLFLGLTKAMSSSFSSIESSKRRPISDDMTKGWMGIRGEVMVTRDYRVIIETWIQVEG